MVRPAPLPAPPPGLQHSDSTADSDDGEGDSGSGADDTPVWRRPYDVVDENVKDSEDPSKNPGHHSPFVLSDCSSLRCSAVLLETIEPRLEAILRKGL